MLCMKHVKKFPHLEIYEDRMLLLKIEKDTICIYTSKIVIKSSHWTSLVLARTTLKEMKELEMCELSSK